MHKSIILFLISYNALAVCDQTAIFDIYEGKNQKLFNGVSCLYNLEFTEEHCKDCINKVRGNLNIQKDKLNKIEIEKMHQAIMKAQAFLANDIHNLNFELDLDTESAQRIQNRCSLNRLNKFKDCNGAAIKHLKSTFKVDPISDIKRKTINEISSALGEDIKPSFTSHLKNKCGVSESAILQTRNKVLNKKSQTLIEKLQELREKEALYSSSYESLKKNGNSKIVKLLEDLSLSSPKLRYILESSNDINRTILLLNEDKKEKSKEVASAYIERCNNYYKSLESFYCSKKPEELSSKEVVKSLFYEEEINSKNKINNFVTNKLYCRSKNKPKEKNAISSLIPDEFKSKSLEYFDLAKGDFLKKQGKLLCRFTDPEDASELEGNLIKFKCNTNSPKKICETLLAYKEVLEEEEIDGALLVKNGEETDTRFLRTNWLLGAFIGEENIDEEQSVKLASVGVIPFDINSPVVDEEYRKSRENFLTQRKNQQIDYSHFANQYQKVAQTLPQKTNQDFSKKNSSSSNRKSFKGRRNSRLQEAPKVTQPTNTNSTNAEKRRILDKIARKLLSQKQTVNPTSNKRSFSSQNQRQPSNTEKDSSQSMGLSMTANESLDQPNLMASSTPKEREALNQIPKARPAVKQVNSSQNVNSGVKVYQAETANIDNMPIYEVVLEGEIAEDLSLFDPRKIKDYRAGQEIQLENLRLIMIESEKTKRPFFLTKIVNGEKLRVLVRQNQAGRYKVEKYGKYTKSLAYKVFFRNIRKAVRKNVLYRFKKSQVATL
jgi:hypothetical protein